MKRTLVALVVLAFAAGCEADSGIIPTVSEIENSPGAINLGGYTFAEDPRVLVGPCEHPGDPAVYHNTYHHSAWAVWHGDVVLAHYRTVCDGEWTMMSIDPIDAVDDPGWCLIFYESGMDPLSFYDVSGFAARCEAVGI